MLETLFLFSAIPVGISMFGYASGLYITLGTNVVSLNAPSPVNDLIVGGILIFSVHSMSFA